MQAEKAGFIESSRKYLTSVRDEFDKVTWPPQKETVSGTVSVVVVVAIIATVLGFVDYLLSQVVGWVLG